MRVPKGVLKSLNEVTEISVNALSDYASARKRPGRNRAEILEKACFGLGLDCPRMIWLYGSSRDIKGKLGAKFEDGDDR